MTNKKFNPAIFLHNTFTEILNLENLKSEAKYYNGKMHIEKNILEIEEMLFSPFEDGSHEKCDGCTDHRNFVLCLSFTMYNIKKNIANPDTLKNKKTIDSLHSLFNKVAIARNWL